MLEPPAVWPPPPADLKESAKGRAGVHATRPLLYSMYTTAAHLVEVRLRHAELLGLGDDQAALFGRAELVRPRVLPAELGDVDVPLELLLPLLVRPRPELGPEQPEVLVVSGGQVHGLPASFFFFFLLVFRGILFFTIRR